MKKALRLFSLLVILEIIIFLFLKLSFFPEILLTNLAFIIILIYFLILLSFLFFFLSTFFENEFSKRIINLFLGKNKVFLLFSYAIIGILLLASLIILIIKDLLIKDFQEILIPLSILGFFLFWEILIFLSFSNLKTRNKRK